MEKEIISLSAKIDPEIFREFKKQLIDLNKNANETIGELIEKFVAEKK